MALLSVTGAKVPPLLGYLPQLAKADAKGSNHTTSFACVKVWLVAAGLVITSWQPQVLSLNVWRASVCL